MSDVRQILRGVLGTVACLGLLASCESASTTVATNPESRLRLSPQELTPIAGCQQSSDDATDMSGYVATLIDVTNTNGKIKPKTILSGPPTTCTSSITFAVSADRGDLEVGNSYVAIVDGYTATGLTAVKRGQRAIESNGFPTTPSWQWLCSFGALPKATLSTLLDIVQTIPRQSILIPDADSSAATDAAASFPDADSIAPDTSSDAATEVADANSEAGPVDASPTVVDASLLDASPQDAAADASSPGASTDTATSSLTTSGTTEVSAVVLDAGLLGLVLGDAASSSDAASSLDAGAAITSDLVGTPDAASSDDVPVSAIDFLLAIAEDPNTPLPATLAQSRLGTLRGCVALP